MSNYISVTMKYGNIVVDIVETYKDVRNTYNKKYMLRDLNIEDKKSEFKLQIQNQRNKMCIT